MDVRYFLCLRGTCFSSGLQAVDSLTAEPKRTVIALSYRCLVVLLHEESLRFLFSSRLLGLPAFSFHPCNLSQLLGEESVTASLL